MKWKRKKKSTQLSCNWNEMKIPAQWIPCNASVNETWSYEHEEWILSQANRHTASTQSVVAQSVSHTQTFILDARVSARARRLRQTNSSPDQINLVKSSKDGTFQFSVIFSNVFIYLFKWNCCFAVDAFIFRRRFCPLSLLHFQCIVWPTSIWTFIKLRFFFAE